MLEIATDLIASRNSPPLGTREEPHPVSQIDHVRDGEVFDVLRF
jgi:hypothetical protein